jgi:AraC-like DNA-binding protein
MAKAGDVASVEFEVGFDSPSQFNREYTRLFGAPPGRDAARLRTALVPRAPGNPNALAAKLVAIDRG